VPPSGFHADTSFEAFHRHARELREMKREMRSREGYDPAEILEAELHEPSVLDVAVELALDDAERDGDLSHALERARRLHDPVERADAVKHAWHMAGEAIMWEGGYDTIAPLARALERRGMAGREFAMGR